MLFYGPFDFGFAGFCHFLGAFVPTEDEFLVLFVAALVLAVAFVHVVHHQEEFAGSCHHFGVFVQTSLSYHIYCFVIIPYLSFVKFDHDAESPLSGGFIRVLEHFEDKILEFSVDREVSAGLVKLFEVVYYLRVQVGPQFLVLAFEQLEEDGQHHCGRDHFLAAHYFEAGDHGHAVVGVQDGVVLLKQGEELGREQLRHLGLEHARDLKGVSEGRVRG